MSDSNFFWYRKWEQVTQKRTSEVIIEFPDYSGQKNEKYVYRELPLETFYKGLTLLKEKSEELLVMKPTDDVVTERNSE